MSLKGKAAAIGIGELKPFKEFGDLTALGLMARVSAEAIADAGLEKNDIETVQDLDKKLPGFGVSDLATTSWLTAPAEKTQ